MVTPALKARSSRAFEAIQDIQDVCPGKQYQSFTPTIVFTHGIKSGADVWTDKHVKGLFTFSLCQKLQPLTMQLIVQISLTGPGINAEGNQEPLVHIGWWGSAIDFDSTLMGFPLHIEPGYELALEGERLFRWTYPEFESEWCYSVRLTDINSPLDVHTHIVNPVKALLLGNDAGSALSDTAAIRYEIVINGQGEYRVLP